MPASGIPDISKEPFGHVLVIIALANAARLVVD
jgi:hypothetical protein